MNTQIQERCKHSECRAPVHWVNSAASGKRILLTEATVEPGTHGALVLIGEIAFSYVPAIERIADSWGIPEADAVLKVKADYGWHLPHHVTCRHRRSE